MNNDELRKQLGIDPDFNKSLHDSMDFTPPEYEDSFIKKAVDDLESRFDKRLKQSEADTWQQNLIIIVISLISLVVAIIGLLK